MYDLFYPFWLMYNMYPNFNNIDKTIIDVVPFDIDDIKNNERVVIYENDKSKIVEVQVYNFMLKQWRIIYRKLFDKYSSINIENGYWSEIDNDILVISNASGSGGFLSYILLGQKNNKYKVIYEKNQIFQGDIWIEDGQLLLKEGNQYNIVRSNNNIFKTVNFDQPVILNARTIQYKISPKGNILIKKNRYYAKVGDIVQLIRKDNTEFFEKIIFSNQNDNIKFIEHRTAIIVTDKSPIAIEIIPGYDWSKSKKINIIVK